MPAASIASATTPSSRSCRAAAGAPLRVRARAAALRVLSLSKVVPHRTRLRVAPHPPRPPAGAHLIRLLAAAQSPASWNGISATRCACAPNALIPCASASNSPSFPSGTPCRARSPSARSPPSASRLFVEAGLQTRALLFLSRLVFPLPVIPNGAGDFFFRFRPCARFASRKVLRDEAVGLRSEESLFLLHRPGEGPALLWQAGPL